MKTSAPARIAQRLAASLAIAAAIACAAAGGCGSSAEFDKATQYSPETLAQELAFRYKALSPSAKAATKRRDVPNKKRGDVMKVSDEQSQVKSQAKAAAKKAPAANVDEVLDEIDAKASKITGQARAEVFNKIADAIDKDASMEAADRQTLADKLKEMGKN